MRIVQTLNTDRITVHLAVADRDQALEALARSFAGAAGESASQPIRDALYERECLASTNLGSGIAVPHARVSGLGEPRMAVAVVREGLEYDDGEPVRILVGLISDLDQPRTHLTMLATLVRVMDQPWVRDRLSQAQDAQDILEALGAAEEQLHEARGRAA